MGCGQYCCFPSPGYVIGRGIPQGPAAYGLGSGVGYGYGSGAVPIPVTATSQVMIASHLPPTASLSPISIAPPPITTLPARNAFMPTYGQNSVMNVPSVVQPMAGNIVAPVQPYGLSSAALRPI